MKSKFFAVVIVLTLGLIFCSTTNAKTPDVPSLNIDGSVNIPLQSSDLNVACPDGLMFRDEGVCVCAVALYDNKIEQVGDECVPIDGYEWAGGYRGADCEGYRGTSPCFPMVEKIEVAPVDPVDSDGDGLTDDVDGCPTEAADTDDGCLAAAGGGGDETSISGGNLSDIDNDTDGSSATEDLMGGGFCTLIENASSTNALSALVLAISLIPLGIRRKIK